MNVGRYGDLELEGLRSGAVLGLLDESALGADEYSGRTLYILANSLPMTPSASLMGHPVGPSTWEDVTSQEDLLRDLAREADYEVTVIAPPDDMSMSSQEILKQIKSGQLPDQAAMVSLGEEIIVRRPVLRVDEDHIEHPDPRGEEFNELWPGFVAAVLPMLGSVGVIGNVYAVDGKNVHAPQGTAWVVAPDLVVTNVHVARKLKECGWMRAPTAESPGRRQRSGSPCVGTPRDHWRTVWTLWPSTRRLTSR